VKDAADMLRGAYQNARATAAVHRPQTATDLSVTWFTWHLTNWLAAWLSG